MLEELKTRQGTPLRIGMAGAGAMGQGIAWQVKITPGMKLAFVTDIDLEVARKAVEQIGLEAIEVADDELPQLSEGQVRIGTDTLSILHSEQARGLDAFVEATNSIGNAAEYCLGAIDAGMHVILMNAEVDLLFGTLLQSEAKKHGVIVTSDAGDQHGVIMTMMREIELWGFDIVQAGNIKGFLDRYATPESIRGEAAKRKLSPVQCCAYTDGTKLNIEMALISNATGLLPYVDGMEGPRCDDVHEVMKLFDFDAYQGQGRVDYILGSEPGGGVYLVGRCDSDFQQPYLEYYKLGTGPYYLFYRPYHLCHLETTRAIAEACLRGRAILRPDQGRVSDVYAYAKQDLKTGQSIEEGIGGSECYGLIRPCAVADPEGRIPIAELEGEPGRLPRVLREVTKDTPLHRDDIEFPDVALHRILRGRG